LVCRALKDETQCDKLNVAAIGNIVPQLHIHVVARRTVDPLWPQPVWGAAAKRPAAEADLTRFAAAIRHRMGGSMSGTNP
jgi:diadenosine tetraphosphate (Ap4A) HIT family hydrolase